MKKRALLYGIVILLLAAAGGFLIMKVVTKAHWQNQELIRYQNSWGGNMNGNSHRVILSAPDYDDWVATGSADLSTGSTASGAEQALLTFSDADWHDQDPEVREYLVDKKALEEIREIFLEEGMYGWKGKKFSSLFVADGETTSYSFIFTEDDLNFSSQIFSAGYREKLEKLDEVIEKYQSTGQLQPGLKVEQKTAEEAQQEPEAGTVTMQVYEYSQNRLYVRITNQTEKELPFYGKYTLTEEDGKVIASDPDGSAYADTVYPESREEKNITLKERLQPGRYTLVLDGCSCNFEIG